MRSTLIPALAVLGLVIGQASAQPSKSGQNSGETPTLTAPYALGETDTGWIIRNATGLGTRSDPIVLSGEINRIGPVRLELTAIRPINPFQRPETHATGTVHFALELINGSGLPWVGMEFELQEILGQPSVYGDGLSFDQRGVGKMTAGSDRFADVHTDFEPYDRILFQSGAVDATDAVRVQLLVTDLTPAPVFFLQIDPRIPAS